MDRQTIPGNRAVFPEKAVKALFDPVHLLRRPLPKVERKTLTMKETAEYLGISYWLVNQLVRRKQIPCARVGGRVLFRVQALDEYLNNKEQESLKK